MSTINTTASGIARDYNRRGIAPDQVTETTHGSLRLWLWCNAYVAELYVGGAELKPGMTILTSQCAYENPLTPQEIADDVVARAGGKITKETRP